MVGHASPRALFSPSTMIRKFLVIHVHVLLPVYTTRSVFVFENHILLKTRTCTRIIISIEIMFWTLKKESKVQQVVSMDTLSRGIRARIFFHCIDLTHLLQYELLVLLLVPTRHFEGWGIAGGSIHSFHITLTRESVESWNNLNFLKMI